MTSTVSIQVERAANTLRVPAAALRFTPTEQVLKEFPASNVEPASSEAPSDGRLRQGSSGQARRAAVWQLIDGRLHRIPVRAGVSDGANVAVSSDALDEGAAIITGIARSEAAADAMPAAGGSPLVPQMPRRPGGNAGGARQSQGR
jgi:hypothetical protein